MTRLLPLLAFGLALGAPLTALAGSPAGPHVPRPHELGWVCINVSDTRLVQVSAFNKDAENLTAWVTSERIHVDLEGDGPGGRVCVPAVTKAGDEALPDNTLVFERELPGKEGEASRPSVAEVVLVPRLDTLAEATTRIVGTADQWKLAGGVWTFQANSGVTFAPKVVRGMPGEGDGPAPPEVFRAAFNMAHFEEPCRPMTLDADVVGNYGAMDSRLGKVVPRGVEPFRLKKGEVVSRCEGVSADGTMVAVARMVDDELVWFIIPRDAAMSPKGTMAYTVDKPLGGYHVCRQPTWSTTILEETDLAGKYELLDNGKWLWLEGDNRDKTVLAPGTPATLVDHREGWALVQITLGGAPRVLALPGRAVAMPTGPASEVRSVQGGLCQWPAGEWRATSAPTQAFRVAQDTPGAELSGLWRELPIGTRVLVLCQTAKKCEPIYVGGAQSSETDRVLLARYAGYLLGVREKDLRERVTGGFETRAERPDLWQALHGVRRDSAPKWALGVGVGGRLSFVESDDFAWALRGRLQRLTDGWGFEGAIGAGVDGLGSFMEFTGGAGVLFTRIEGTNLELRGSALAKLDLRFEGGGGLGFDVIAKGQLRWVNDVAPVSLEVGVNVGFGGTFGAKGKGHVTFGMPLWLNVELLSF